MGADALIVTSEDVTAEALASFVAELGGQPVAGAEGRLVVADGDTDVWLAIQPDEFFGLLHSEETVLQWRKALGQAPRKGVELMLDHGPKRRQLYLYIAYAFSLRWNMILDDIDDTIITAEELHRRCREECTDLTITFRSRSKV